jgi:translation initiation factor 2B subunit (eIF-2B alpha/beta/delta family)
VSDSFKIGNLAVNSDDRGKAWFPTDIAWERRLTEIQSYNPREDIVDPDLITAIVTEQGQVAPREVWTHQAVTLPAFLTTNQAADRSRSTA